MSKFESRIRPQIRFDDSILVAIFRNGIHSRTFTYSFRVISNFKLSGWPRTTTIYQPGRSESDSPLWNIKFGKKAFIGDSNTSITSSAIQETKDGATNLDSIIGTILFPFTLNNSLLNVSSRRKVVYYFIEFIETIRSTSYTFLLNTNYAHEHLFTQHRR